MSTITAALLQAAASRITLPNAPRPAGETVLGLAAKDQPVTVSDTVFADGSPTQPPADAILGNAITAASGASSAAFSGSGGYSRGYLGQLLDLTA